MSARIDARGQRFGRLLVIELAGSCSTGATWTCLCDCGRTVVVQYNKLATGRSRSCGCLMRETIAAGAHRSHGLSNTPEYSVWTNMKTRCYNQTNPSYADYGARGVRMSDEWRADFAAFYRDMGPRPSPKHSIDRKDPSGNYCAENCSWVHISKQASNKRTTRRYSARGFSGSLNEVCDHFGVPYMYVYNRLRTGAAIEDVLSTLG